LYICISNLFPPQGVLRSISCFGFRISQCRVCRGSSSYFPHPAHLHFDIGHLHSILDILPIPHICTSTLDIRIRYWIFTPSRASALRHWTFAFDIGYSLHPAHLHFDIGHSDSIFDILFFLFPLPFTAFYPILAN